MLWFDFLVRTSIGVSLPQTSRTPASNRLPRAKPLASLRPALARRSLKPQLNQIRTWVRQGRTDAWIAHQLEVSVSDIRGFKREHGLAPAEAGNGDGEPAPDVEEPDLRAEDDALVAAALEEEADEEPEPEPEPQAREDEDQPKSRRRGRRGGRVRWREPSTMATKAMDSGSIPPCRMTRSTPSTGQATGP